MKSTPRNESLVTMPAAEAPPSGMGSEYMDARSYLARSPAKIPRVTASDDTFHGSNESNFIDLTPVDE